MLRGKSMKKTSVLKEIATELNLSINSVSRALRDCSDISEKTKERVRKKAIELGYIQNTLSRLLAYDDTGLIAIIVKSFGNPYYTTFVQSFIENTDRSDYTFMVLPIDQYSIDENVIKQCISQRVTFLITLCHISDKAIEYCQLNGIPVCSVGFDINHPYCSSVFPDYEQMVYLAEQHLHQKYGISEVVYCSKTLGKSEGNRYRLLCDQWKKICPQGNVSWLTMENEDKITELCYKNEVGIFCYNDELAFSIIQLARNKYGSSFDHNSLKIVGIDGISIKVCGMMDITSSYCDFTEMISVIKELIKNTSEGSNARVRYTCSACLHIKAEL